MSPGAPELRIYGDPEALAEAVADEFAARAAAASGPFSVALSGGGTPLALYRRLATAGYRAAVPWGRVHLFWGDERVVPPDHEDSNYGAARRAFLSRVDLPGSNIHRIKGELDDPSQAAAEYEAELRRHFDLRPDEFPRFDLVLLGLGADGHTASLFPGSAALRERERLVAAPWVSVLDAHRITLTCPVFNNAACIIFMVTGGGKAETLRRVLAGGEEAAACPAAHIRPTAGELYWYADRAAAAGLERA